MFKLFVGSLCIVAVASAAPVIELSLASSSFSHPSTASSIVAAESKRDAIVESGLRKLMLAYNSAKVAGAKQLSAAIGGSGKQKSSFAAFNPVEPTLKAHLVEASTDESAAASEINVLEESRNNNLEGIINQAVSEFAEITKVIVGEFSRQISYHTKKTSFLKGSGINKELNVNLFANQNYATVGNLVEQAEKRRDVVENHLRQHILDLELRLVEFLISAGQKAIR